MSRFNSPEEVAAWADKAALGDMQRHIGPHNLDLNPYCTPCARDCWRRGYDNRGPRSYQFPREVDFDHQYQRGAAAARLVKSNQEKYA